MDYQSSHVMNLANSIIGVSILAMPYCFKQCGIILSILMLLISSVVSRLACHFLLKSAIICRRKTFEYLAFYIFGALGKFAIEVGIIGFLIGTCIAFFVVMGDLGPEIIAEVTGTKSTNTLRASILMALALFCVLPLGLLRNVDSLNGVSKATIGFYCCLVMKIIIEALHHMFRGDWIKNVILWRPEGILQCLPIFSMALCCQPQLFEIYQTIPNASLDKMNGLISRAVNMCTSVYIFVGIFGYIAFSERPFTGNILLSFEPSVMSDVLKIGFVLSLVFSFPLIIFPCRASLYSLLYKEAFPVHEGSSNYIPEGKFKAITMVIVLISLVIGLLIPNIELVLGLVGSTIGFTICLLFPVLSFICISPKNTNERALAQLMLCVGIVVMILATYENLHVYEARTEIHEFEKGKDMNPKELIGKKAIETVTSGNFSVNKNFLKNDANVEVILEDIQKQVEGESRHEPPQPEEPAESPEKAVKQEIDNSADNKNSVKNDANLGSPLEKVRVKEVEVSRHEPPHPEEAAELYEKDVNLKIDTGSKNLLEEKNQQKPIQPVESIVLADESVKIKIENESEKQNVIIKHVVIDSPLESNDENKKIKPEPPQDKKSDLPKISDSVKEDMINHAKDLGSPNNEKAIPPDVIPNSNDRLVKENRQNVASKLNAGESIKLNSVNNHSDEKINLKLNEEVDAEAIRKEETELKEQEKDKQNDDSINQALIDTIQKQSEVQKVLVEQQKKLIEVMQKQDSVNIVKVKEDSLKAMKQIESIARQAIEDSISGNDKLPPHNAQPKEDANTAVKIKKNISLDNVTPLPYLNKEKLNNSQNNINRIKEEFNLVPLPIAVAQNNTILLKAVSLTQNNTVQNLNKPKEEPIVQNERNQDVKLDSNKDPVLEELQNKNNVIKKVNENEPIKEVGQEAVIATNHIRKKRQLITNQQSNDNEEVKKENALKTVVNLLPFVKLSYKMTSNNMVNLDLNIQLKDIPFNIKNGDVN